MAGSRTLRFDLVGDDARLRRALRGTGRELDHVGDRADHAGGRIDRFGVRTERAADRGGGAVLRMGGVIGVQSDLSVRKLLAIAGAANVAGEALSATAALTIAAGSSLAQLAGLAGAGATGMTALAQGLGLTKAAASELEPAFKALSDAQDGTREDARKAREELDKLPASSRRFVRELVDAEQVLDRIRQQGTGPMFAGAQQGLQAAMGSADEAGRVAERTGRSLGHLAREAGELAGSRPWQRDLEQAGTRNARIIRILGQAALAGADGLRHVIVAAGPLTERLAKSTRGLADQAREAARTGRQTGELERYFARTGDTVERLVHTTGQLAGGLINVGQQARPTGDRLWESVDRAATRWHQWTMSAAGERALGGWFRENEADAYRLAGAIEDVLSDPEFDSATLGGKLGIAIERTSPHVSRAFGDLIERAMPVMAENAAQAAPHVAASFVTGFLNAGPWGRLLLTGLLLKKVGGLAGIRRFGSRVGTTFGTSVAAGAAPGLAAASTPLTGRAATARAGAGAGAAAGAGGAIALGPGYAAERRARIEQRRIQAGMLPRSQMVDTRTGGWLSPRQPSRIAQAARARAAQGWQLARGGAAAGLAAFGGPWGLAAAGGLILGPSVVQAAQRSSQGRYGLLRESGGERFGRQHLGFLQTDTDRRQARVLAWNETATSRADRAYGRLDARGLRKMADEARRMGAEARKSGDELAETAPKYDKFARDAEAAAKRVQWANRLFGKGKVGADDVVDRLAAVRVKERFERMRQDGIRSIGGMRARMTRDMRLIEQGFTAGSRGASEAMRRHFDIGIDSMSDAMRRGRVDAGRGAREIAQVTRRQMEAMSSGVMDNSRESRAALADDFGDGIKAVRRAMRDGKMSTDEGMTAIRRITRQQMQATKARLTDDSAAGRAALATNMLRAADAVRTQMRRAGRETKEGTRLIRRYMVDALQDMGLSARSTRNILKGGNDDREFGDKDRNLGREGGAPINYDRAHGGWIGRAGLRGHDRIMVRAGLGEYVANGDDQAVIEPSLALAAAAGLHSYPSLEALDAARARKRPHAATGSGPSPLLAMARGGRVSLMGADPDLAGYARLSGRFGLRVSSGLRPGSITSSGNRSHHGTGDALDLAGAPAAMLRFARHIASRFGRRLEELIYTPLGWSIKNGRRVPAYAQADHYDHVHIADTDASGVAGGASMIPRIRRVRVSGLHGQVRVLAQGAVDRVRAGAQRRVNRAAQRMMDAGAVGGPGAGGAGSIPMGRLRGLIAQALRFTGHWAPTPANVNAVLGRVMQESGGNPNALNDWDINARRGDPSIGLLQTIGATFARYRDRRLPNNIRHPLANLVAGLNYMKAVYGRIVASNGRGYERGGVVGRFLRRATGRGLAGTRTVRGGGLLARNVRTGAPRRFPRGATVPAEVARVYGITARQARRHRITIQGRLSPRELLGERAQDREAFARRTEQIQSELALRERRFALDEEDLADPDELAEALQEGRGLIRPLRRQAQLQEQVVESYDDTLDDLQDQYRAERRRAGRSYEQRRAEFGLSRTERRREIRGEDRQQKRLRRRLDDPDVTGRRRERMTDRLRESRAREQRLERIRKADEGQRRRMQRTLTEEHRKAQRRRAEQHRRRQRGVRGERRDAAGQLAETRLSIREQQAELAEQTGPAAVLASQLEMIDLRERAGRISEAQAAAERAFARQVALTRPMSERDRLAVEADMRAETGPLARVAGAMEQIDLHLRAGSFGTDAGAEQRANQWRQGVIAQTLAAGGLTDREALELRAQLREATEAIEQAQRAQEEHTAALKSVSEEMKRNNDIAQGVMATTGREAVRALADVLSGQLGAMTTSRAPTPGYGTSWRF